MKAGTIVSVDIENRKGQISSFVDPENHQFIPDGLLTDGNVSIYSFNWSDRVSMGASGIGDPVPLGHDFRPDESKNSPPIIGTVVYFEPKGESIRFYGLMVEVYAQGYSHAV